MKLWKDEKKTAKLFVEHAETVRACLDASSRAIIAYLDGIPIEEPAAGVDRLESEADELTRAIRDVLYEGAFLPLLREDLFELNAEVDAVANAAESAVQFFDRQRPAIPEALRPMFKSLAEASAEAFTPLVQALEEYFQPKGKQNAVQGLVRRVLDDESAADAVEAELTRALFNESLPLAEKLHLQQCVMSLAKVADRAENAADRLGQVSLKSPS